MNIPSRVKKIVPNLLLSILSIAIALFVVNIFVVFCIDYEYGRLADIRRAAKRSGVSFDERSRGEVIDSYERLGEKVVPALGTNFVSSDWWQKKDSLLPLGGISSSETVFCNENGAYVVYKSDRFGFYNDDTLWDLIHEDKAVIIGDSFAHGACVNQDETTQAVMTLLGVPTISVGIGGNGPLAALAALREYGSRIHPRHVVYLFYEGNDLLDLEREVQTPSLSAYLEDEGWGQGLTDLQSDVDYLWRGIIEQEKNRNNGTNGKHSKLESVLKFHGVTQVWRRFRRHVSSVTGMKLYKKGFKSEDELLREEEIANKYLMRVLGLMSNEAKRLNAVMHFVYVPDYHSLQKKHSLSTKQIIVTLVEKLDIDFLDFEKILRQQADFSAYFPFGQAGHLSPAGYRFLAQRIVAGFPSLSSNNNALHIKHIE